jgi:hypothetical protein
MTTKAAAANGVSAQEEKQLAVIDPYLEEMTSIRIESESRWDSIPDTGRTLGMRTLRTENK